jgi:hypothetical protein
MRKHQMAFQPPGFDELRGAPRAYPDPVRQDHICHNIVPNMLIVTNIHPTAHNCQQPKPELFDEALRSVARRRRKIEVPGHREDPGQY